MSVDYSALAIIGLRIDPTKLYGQIKTIRKLDHDFPETFKYHPETGETLWTKTREPIAAFVENDEVRGPDWDESGICHDFHPSGKLAGYQVISPLSIPHAFVVLLAVDSSGQSGFPIYAKIPTDLVDQMREFRVAMEKIEFWSTKNFGLWSALNY